MQKKIFLIFVICIICILCALPSFASDISSDADSFLSAASGETPDRSGMDTAISDIAGILTGIAVIAAVVVAAVLGIQFMIGSTEQQAKIKESILPYICGCVVAFGALGIWQLVIAALNEAQN